MSPTDPKARLTLWLVNQYALRIDQPGITRHATLAKYLHGMGVDTTIFASPTHYWNVQQADRAPAPDEPTFRYTLTQPVESNGVRRVLSMVSFAVRTYRDGLAAVREGQESPDVVIGSSPHPFAAVSAWGLARHFDVPFILEVRDLWPDSLVQLMGVSQRHPLIVTLRGMERFLYRRAALVVTLLPGSQAHIEKVAGRPVDVVWIPNGSDLSRVPSTRPITSTDPFVVMYAGAHGIPNSLETLLDAAALLRDQGEDRVHFVFVGDGKEKSALVARAKELGLTNVEWRPAVAKSELLDILPSAHALVVAFRKTSLYRDGISPNKVFDYGSVARPTIIAVDTPLNPVAEADSGLTIAPEDPAAMAEAIRTLADLSPDELNAMGQRGRAYIEEHHSHARLAERLRSAIDRVRAAHVRGRINRSGRSQ